MLAQWLKASCCGAKPIATAALGQTRRFDLLPATSDLPQSTDIVRAGRHVSKVPSADLLNHLVGDSPDQTRLLMFSVADWFRWR
jgi:hypothetical protein